MSENLEQTSENLEPTQEESQPVLADDTQSNLPVQKDDTQPVKPVKPSRWRSILLGILGILAIIVLGGLGGYSSGLGLRTSAEDALITGQMTEQFQFALVDIEFGRYEAARQRLEFIISHDPSFPGAADKLTEVMVLSVIPTFTPTPTLTSTPDFSGAENAYARAQQLIAAQDWPGALAALDTIRKLDPTYKTAQVDGMYYFALRNYGYSLITQQGNLEGGIYQLTLAERFGPLDQTSNQLREGARMYITGASFWELDWSQAVAYFSQVGTGWPALYDGTMTGAQRYYIASMRYGDDLFEKEQYCDAYEQYQNAAAINALDEKAARNSAQAFVQCYPATPTLEPTATGAVVVPTDTVPVVDPPTDTPTDTPTP
jgi:tetratricopeptide (TPR) repeat protein